MAEPTYIDKMKELEPKQKRFCEEYVVDFNGTQAAIRAGYSKKTASVIASENLAKPKIQAYLATLKEKLVEKTEISKESLIADLAAIIGNTRSDKPDTATRAIAQISKMLGFDAPTKSDVKLSVGLSDILKEIDGKSTGLSTS